MTDLDAIRARDAAMPFNDPQSEWDSHARAAWDRRALLAEVDRLRAERDIRLGEVYEAGEKGERARIRAAVDGLRDLDKLSPMEQRVWAEACAAVLAAIDGEGEA